VAGWFVGDVGVLAGVFRVGFLFPVFGRLVGTGGGPAACFVGFFVCGLGWEGLLFWPWGVWVVCESGGVFCWGFAGGVGGFLEGGWGFGFVLLGGWALGVFGSEFGWLWGGVWVCGH